MNLHSKIDHVIQNVNAHSGPLLHYGSIALFFLLAFGIFGLFIPEETLMVAAGFLINQGKLNLPITVSAAFLGVMCGISVSYLIGRYGGSILLEKYAHWVRLTPQRIQRTRLWFSRFGMWALFIGYFLPVVRHFTGYLTGTMRIPFSRFALFAFSGAVIWASIFITIGYLLGKFFVGP